MVSISPPVPLRSVPAALCAVDGGGRCAVVFPGVSRGSEDQTGQHRCLETHLTKTGWDWLLQLCGVYTKPLISNLIGQPFQTLSLSCFGQKFVVTAAVFLPLG